MVLVLDRQISAVKENYKESLGGREFEVAASRAWISTSNASQHCHSFNSLSLIYRPIFLRKLSTADFSFYGINSFI